MAMYEWEQQQWEWEQYQLAQQQQEEEEAAQEAAQQQQQQQQAEGWVAHHWFTGHRPTGCIRGWRALASGCVAARVRSAADVPPLHNTRPVMARNDTHQFDLLVLAPVVHGWVLLGEAGAYVRVSRDRFESVTFAASGNRFSKSS